jgi:hypothetical protein
MSLKSSNTSPVFNNDPGSIRDIGVDISGLICHVLANKKQ